MVTYIPKPDLIVGRKYRCLARNFEVGVWNGTGFDYMRVKFGHAFPDVEFHYDDGPPYGTVRPLELVDE